MTEIRHFSDEHPLVQTDYDGGHILKCDLCLREAGPEAGPLYGCKDCFVFLHKSCAELQLAPQIEHPLHPLHPLVFEAGLRGNRCRRGYACRCCKKQSAYFSYRCKDCKYDLDLECAALSPTLKLRDPRHLLFLFDKVDFDETTRCSVCGDDFAGAGSNLSVFVCAIPQCDYVLHLHCSPLTLPETVRHENHNFHDLIYTKSVTEGGFWDGHYCDACEEQRDPKLPVYYCKECNFASHVICGISKELPSLVEAYENDCLQRGASLAPFLRYYQEECSRLRSEIESVEAEMKEARPKIDAAAEELALYRVSKLLA